MNLVPNEGWYKPTFPSGRDINLLDLQLPHLVVNCNKYNYNMNTPCINGKNRVIELW